MDTKPTYKELEQRIAKLEAQTQRYKEIDLAPIFKGIEKSFPMGIADHNGMMIYVNGPLVKMWGYSSEKEIIGKSLTEFWEGDGIFRTIDDLINTGWSMGEDIGKRKDGSLFNAEYVAIMCKDNGGEPLYMLGQFFDITKRKRTEEALRQSEATYREIANRVPGMVYQFVQHQDGSFSIPFISDQVYEYSGYKPEEVMTEPDLLFKPIHPEDIEMIQGQIAKSAKSLNDFSVEHRLTTPDGKILWFHVKSRPRLLENGDISWSGISIDITKRKNIEQELKKSEERYQSVSELTSDYSYAYRVEPDGELILEWVTGALKRLTGFTREEVRSRGGWESLIYLDDMPIPLGQLKSLLSNQSKTVEYRITDKAGNIRWMRDFAKPIWDKEENRLKQIYGAVQEFTEQKDAVEALRSSHERFLTVMDSIDATIYVADMETYEILFMNKHMIASFGRDMTGEICWDVFRNETGPCPHCTNARLIDAKGEPTDVCVWQDKNPITGKWYINYDRAIRWIDDRLVRLQIASDITDLKALEEERMQFEEKLRQTQKMEAIGTLAGGIAHDFNNILSAIVGYTELALAKTSTNAPLHEDLQEVFRAGLRARDLVKQILTFSRQAEQNLQPVQVNLIVKEALKFLRSSLPSSIKIHPNIISDARVLADPTQIHQVLMNLCANAKHAMRKTGGVLEVSLLEVQGSEFAAAHPEVVACPHLKLTVADSGGGMSAEVREKIFDPFFTTKGKEEGTGLGLAVVHGIVKSGGGFLTVSSEPGKGSTFNVFLPIIEAQDKPQAEIKGPLPTGSERVLFEDDEKILVDIGT